MTIQPQRTALKSAVKLKRALPDVSSTGMLLDDVRKDEHTFTLLDQTCGTAEGTARQGGGKGLDGLLRHLGCRSDGLLVAAALYPRGGVHC